EPLGLHLWRIEEPGDRFAEHHQGNHHEEQSVHEPRQHLHPSIAETDTTNILYPKGKVREAARLASRAAASPMTSAEQSNSMWKPSEMSPSELVHIPYRSSTPVNS
ncbi:unnamed protein product, partial [Ixodes hexagonus]